MSTPAWAHGRRFCIVAVGSELEQTMKKRALDFVAFDPKRTEVLFKQFLTKKKCNVFIFEAFKGPLYDHAMAKSASILSMAAALRLMELDDKYVLPAYSPLLSLAMAGVKASCTNVSPEQRASLHTLIQQMGGEVNGDLMVEATHLVAGAEPGWHKTIKYKAALEMNAAVVTTEWVHDAFQKGRTATFSATTPEFVEKHRLKIFRDCVICVTQLPDDQRARIKNTLPQHGGLFQPHLSKDCTHLIATSPEGQKYTAALSLSGTYIVRASWFDECLRIRGRAEESPFTFTATNSEAAATLTPSESSLELGDQWFFLDGVRVYLFGFAGTRQTHMIKLVRLTGAVLVNGDPTRSASGVNYIVCAFQPDAVQLNEWRALAQPPVVVHPTWLVEGYQRQAFLPTLQYEVVSSKEHPPPAPIPPHKQPQPASAAGGGGKGGGDDKDADGMFFDQDWDPIGKARKQAPAVTGALKMFAGLVFAVVGHMPAAASRLGTILTQQGARMEANPASADISIVPLLAQGAELPAGLVVTHFWIEMCLQESRLLSPTARLFFQPCQRWQRGITHPWPLQRVGAACVCLSGFEDMDKMQLDRVMRSLGFRMSDELRRRDCTHLVCSAPTGKKYETAKHWRLPVVSIDWVFQSAIADELLPPDSFQILTPLPPLRAFNRDTDLVTVRESAISEKSFHPAFDVGDALSMLRTPNQSLAQSTSSSLEAMLSRNLKDAAARTGPAGQPGGFLDDVVVYVSKTASSLKRETMAQAREFGLRVAQTLDSPFTHLIFQGRLVDTNREVRTARTKQVTIVSAHWLTECLRCNMRAPEKLFPSTYDPARTLPDMSSLVSTGTRADVAMGSDDEDDLPMLPPGAALPIAAAAAAASATAAAPGARPAIAAPTLTSVSSLAVSSASATATGAGGAADPSPVLLGLDANTGFAVPSRRPGPVSVHAPTTPQTVPPTPARSSAAAARHAGTDDDIETKIAAILKASENIASSRTRRAQRNVTTPLSDGRSSGSFTNPRRVSDVDPENDPDDSLTQPAIKYEDPCTAKRQKLLARLMAREAPEEQPPESVTTLANGTGDGPGSMLFAPVAMLAPMAVLDDRRLASVRDDDATMGNTTASCDLPTATASGLAISRRRYAFLLSSMSADEKQRLTKIIVKLGGEIFETANFVPECTHVIVSSPSRNEKYLAACAAGKWVLRPSYIAASEQAGRFVSEESHEWVGSSEQTPSSRDLASAPRRWRILLHDGRSLEPGAFSEWRVLLAVTKPLLPAFRRLLEAGGCRSIRDSPPYDADKATHALVDDKSPHLSQLFSAVAVRNLPCLRVEYISEFLLSPSPPDLARFTLRRMESSHPDDQMSKRSRAE